MKKALDTGALQWAKELSYDRYGRPKLKMCDRLEALKQLDTIFGLRGENRNDNAIEELKRERFVMRMNAVRASDPAAYAVLVERFSMNPETRKYIPLLDP